MKLEGNVYRTVVRPALPYGTDAWSTMTIQEKRLEANEMMMLRWIIMWSHEERLNQKRTCERISKSSTSDKEDHG